MKGMKTKRYKPSPEPFYSESSLASLPLKEYENYMPTIERVLDRNLQGVSEVLYAQIAKDNWEKHEEAVASYADLKAESSGFHDATYKDQENNDTSLRNYERLNKILSNLQKVHDAVKDDPTLNAKVLEATDVYVKNSAKLTELNLHIKKGDLRKFSDIGSWEVPSFDGPEPQPLLNSPSLDVSLGDVIGPEPPIKPHSLNSSRMKVVDYLITQTLPSPHVTNSHPKGVYSYYNPCIDNPKRYCGFKPGLLGKSVSLGVNISNWEMFDDDWGLESKEVSPLGE
ncbi:hypothetical protein Tco_0073064 [Tanacetum coccineum]